MQPEIIVALITAVGGIIIAGITAYSSAKKAHREALKELKELIHNQGIIVHENELKVNTLWEIYVEDAIRSAQKEKIIASKSLVRPTKELESVMSPELQKQIAAEVLELSVYMSSPYNIAIEIWAAHKRELLTCSQKAEISVRATWGGLVTLVHATLIDNNKISIEDVPLAMAGE